MNNQHDIDKELEKLLQDTENEVVKAYARALNEIRLQVAKLFEKYADGDKLSYQDAMRYNRLDKLMREIVAILQELYGVNLQLVATAQIQQLEEAYYRTMYVMEQGVQQALSFTLLNPNTIKAAVNNPIAKLTLNKILERNRDEIVKKLRQEITQGLIQGEGYAKIAQRFVDALDKDRAKALRVARTEGGRAHSLGKLAAYEETERLLPDTEKMWVSSLDHRTRPSHRTLDGKKANKDGYFQFGKEKALGPRLFGNPQLDINCRCSFIVLVDGIEPTVRRERDYQDGGYQTKLAKRIDKLMEEGYTEKQATKMAEKEIKPPGRKIPYQTYEEWNKGLSKRDDVKKTGNPLERFVKVKEGQNNGSKIPKDK